MNLFVTVTTGTYSFLAESELNLRGLVSHEAIASSDEEEEEES